MHTVPLNKKLYLALLMARKFKNNFFNTNDLATLANSYNKELVRHRKDKTDYKYLDDTNFGGLRGNFSTILTLRGLVKRGSRIVGSYSVGRDARLKNAVISGSILLDTTDFTAKTNSVQLKNLLETEDWLHYVRETQAHAKVWLQRNQNIPLTRDNVDYPKEAVFKSTSDQFFIRALVNNFVDAKQKILEFNLLNLWEGKKFKIKNIHPLLIIPTKSDARSEIFAVKNEDLIENKPLFLQVDVETKKCFDKHGNEYKLYPLDTAIEEFSKSGANSQTRLDYNWSEVRKELCEEETDIETRKDDEFSSFLNSFLRWQKEFKIDGKQVADIRSISSGGPDVELIFSGGTKQKVELEHEWATYFEHNHQVNNAFKSIWLFAEEPWNKQKVLSLFLPHKLAQGDRVPDVFLCIEDGERKAYRANWDKKEFDQIDLEF